jgi:hypothetical protein
MIHTTVGGLILACAVAAILLSMISHFSYHAGRRAAARRMSKNHPSKPSPGIVGAGTVIDIRGERANPYRNRPAAVANSQAIYSDWEHVGDTLRSIMDDESSMVAGRPS